MSKKRRLPVVGSNQLPPSRSADRLDIDPELMIRALPVEEESREVACSGVRVRWGSKIGGVIDLTSLAGPVGPGYN